MHPLPKNSKEDDTDSSFDFLNAETGEDGNKSVGEAVDPAQSDGSNAPAMNQSGRNKFSENPFPVIRKPVSISKSGALKAPRANQPVEPPPPLTDALRSKKEPPPESLQARETPDFSDLDKIFEDEQQQEWPGSEQWVNDEDISGREQWLDDESTAVTEQWIDDAHRPIGQQYRESGSSWGRKLAYILAFVFISAGLLATVYSVPQARQWSQDTLAKVSGLISIDNTESEDSLAGGNSNPDLTVSENTDGSLADASGDGEIDSRKSLYTLFNEELANVEKLVEQGDFDGVDNALQTMDPLVFGYGSTEFTEIQNQVASLREQSAITDEASSIAGDQQDVEQQEQAERTAAEVLAEQEQIEAENVAEETRLAEQQRVEQEQTELAEAARQAEQLAEQEQAASLEKEEEEKRLELERQAAEAAEAEQIRADRLAQEKARAEQFRIALEERARNEQRLEEERLEEQRLEALRVEEERLAELRAEVQRLEEQRLEEQRLAELREEELRLEEQRLAELREEEKLQEEQRLARQAAEELAQTQEEIAAQQREAARQQRLADARAREAQQEEQRVDTIAQPEQIPAEDLELALVESTEQQITADAARPIAESELQQVYRQFSELESAIESRDINAVVRLTESSGARIQQVLQMFENNVSIEAQLRNVSTLDSAGEIRGTLQITRLQRVDGSVTGPPRNFDSVPILSVRKGGGWSQIRW